jgi:neutral peptidase B
VKVTGVGREATEKIYYRALTKYLTANSDFKMMRQAALQSAEDLYGKNSKELQAVTKAYDAVGVK